MKRMILVPVFFILTFAAVYPVTAQQASQNIPVLPVIPQVDENGVEDPLWYLKGDGYLQRQVEPSIAVSTRNPDHLLSFFVDYRAVDVSVGDVGLGEETQTWTSAMAATSLMLDGLISLPQIPHLETPPIAAAEAWVGGSRSYDGGLTWRGFFMPGAPPQFYDDSGVAPSDETQQMPIYGLQAATDPVAVAGPCGYVYVVFMAFTRGDESKMVVARFQDLNNLEGGDTWEFQGMAVVESGNNATNGYFLDKPAIGIDVFRDSSDFSTYAPSFSDYECGHSVYISYSTFNGLEADGKFRSKINFARSDDAGQTWTKSKIQQPYNQNQGSAIAVDPNNGDVYFIWRHFFDPDTVLMVKTTDRGKKFSKPVDLTEGSQMYPYDQPTVATNSVNPWTGIAAHPFEDLTFRSNAFPTAAVVANGDNDSTVFVAWQEYVDGLGYPSASASASPRIVLTRSADGGETWTGPGKGPYPNNDFWPTRRAVDFADRDQPCNSDDYYFDDPCIPEPGFGALPDDRPSGPQVMPWLSAGGGKLALAYHESRGLYTGEPGLQLPDNVYGKQDVGIDAVGLTGWGFISGLDRVVDFRVALLDTVTGFAVGTSQVSRYPISAGADLTLNGEDVDDVARIVPSLCGEVGAPPEYCQPRLDFKNKPQSASGTAPFQGDYPGMSPISPFVFDGNVWKWATSESDVTYPGFHVVFADNRNLVPATTGATYEENRYGEYDPANCVNVGSRNTDVMTAQINADIVVSAPTTYKSLENPVNSFPFTIRNTTDQERTFDLWLDGDTANSSFSYDIYGEDPLDDADDGVDEGTVKVYPFSSVSQVVYISDTAVGPVYVNIQEDGGLKQSATLTFNAGFFNDDDYLGIEVDNPFVRNPFVRNPFVRNPFVRNSSTENLSVSNPFVRNPFVRNSSIEDGEVEEIIDATWTAEPESGATTAATYYPVININNAAQFLENYAFQLIVWKQSGFGGANGCDVGGIPQDQILSNVVQGADEDPFVLNPNVSNPFVRNESVSNPFVRNPFVRNPFVRNSAFTMAPADLEPNTGTLEATAKFSSNAPDDVTLSAPPASNGVNITLRAHRLKKYCDEPGANSADCLQKPACLPGEDLTEILCDPNVIECGPDQNPIDDGCVIPSFIYNPNLDPPSVSVGSERCFMRIVADPYGEYQGLSYEQRIALAETECFKSMAADLIPRVFENPEGSVAEDGTLQFPDGWQVFNQGDSAATAENRALQAGFYLSTDDVLDFDDETGKLDQLKGDRWLRDVVVGGIGTTIEAGEFIAYTESTGHTDIKIPSWDELPVDSEGNTISSYYLILYVDNLLEVSERNEINNFFTAVFTLTIEPPNASPVADEDLTFPTDEDTALVADLPVSDPEDDELTFAIVSGPAAEAGTVTLEGDDVSYGQFKFVPVENYNGSAYFTFSASDGEFSIDVDVTIEVVAINDSPVVSLSAHDDFIGEGETISFTATVDDPDIGDSHTYEWKIDGVVQTEATTSLESFTFGGDGSYLVSVTATDIDQASDSDSVRITVTNSPPETTIAVIPTVADEGDVVEFSAAGSFDPGGDSIEFTWEVNGSPVATGETVEYVFVNDGEYSVTVIASDGVDSTRSNPVTVQVANVAPTALGSLDDPNIGQENDPVSIVLSAFDPGDDELTVVFDETTVQPTHGALVISETEFSGSPRVLTVLYEPNPYFYGTDVFSYKVSDGSAVSELAAQVNVVILPVDYYTVIAFQDPWQPPQPIYTIKAGSGVPLKWQYSDGTDIVDSGSWDPRPQIWVHKSVDCGVPSVDDPDSETQKFINDTGSSDYRYFQDTDTWQFNWDTTGTAKGECYNMYVYTPNVNELSQAFQIKFK